MGNEAGNEAGKLKDARYIIFFKCLEFFLYEIETTRLGIILQLVSINDLRKGLEIYIVIGREIGLEGS